VARSSELSVIVLGAVDLVLAVHRDGLTHQIFFANHTVETGFVKIDVVDS